MKKFLLCSLLLVTGCTPSFLEKQSEPLKQAVYGVNDSLTKGRIDLTWYYSNETTRLVNPPKERIQINGITENVQSTKDSKNTSEPIVILPEILKGKKVITINSAEYNELLKDKEIAKQFEIEIKKQKEFTQVVKDQQLKNEEIQSKLLKSYNDAKTELSKKDSAIWFRNFVILGLLVLIGGYIGLRVAISYGKLSLPFMI